MESSKTHILKFGGSSLQNETFIKQAAQIVADRRAEAQPVTVVSAVDGVTDTLIEIAEHPEQAAENIDELERQHLNLYYKFAASTNGQSKVLHRLFNELREVVGDDYFRQNNYPAWKDRILSFGERASTILFSAALSAESISSTPVTTHEMIKTDSRFSEARVDQAQSQQLIREKFAGLSTIPVVTGFIGADKNGNITTLGRSGSDYTAGIIAGALEADQLEIWTDVDGVLSADPRWVPTAKNIEALSFTDIEELAAHGANVIHPKTIQPVRNGSTSVIVKNSYNPSHSGTVINRNYLSNGSFKTITVTGPFVRLTVDNRYAFNLLTELNNLSEHETSDFTFKGGSTAEPARFLLDQSFFKANKKHLQGWENEYEVCLGSAKNLYKVKKFSNQFKGSEQLMSRIWSLLANRNLQPLHVERNHDERFLSLLFNKDDALRAARLFDTYLQHDKKVIDIYLAGNGAVGSSLLRQLSDLATDDFEFRLIGICNSRQYLWSNTGLDYEKSLNWEAAKPTDWKDIIGKLTQPNRHNAIFVDATGSGKIARLYPKLLKNGVHIVTPSKLANTFEQAFFDELQTIAKNNGSSFRYETNVGAGLPVISTLSDLQESGDEILEISGVVSGTMTYIFNQLKEGTSFSEAVIKARKLGYAEPDPRDDLSGEDVARKFLTMARTLGIKTERRELQVESLVPNALSDKDRNTFLEKLPEYDSYWKNRIDEVLENNQTLQYTGRFKDGEVTIGIQAVPLNSPMGQLKGTDNIIRIYSKFYNQTPLIVQGAGAGKKVTASGVLSDILKTAETLN